MPLPLPVLSCFADCGDAKSLPCLKEEKEEEEEEEENEEKSGDFA